MKVQADMTVQGKRHRITFGEANPRTATYELAERIADQVKTTFQGGLPPEGRLEIGVGFRTS